MKVLLGTAATALVLSGAAAIAEVSVSGDGRMGIESKDGADMKFNSRIRIKFSASGETDGGLTFGGSIRADNAGNGATGSAGSVHVAGPFGTLSMGDIGSAAKEAVGHGTGVGYAGLGDLNEIKYIGDDDLPTARWDYTMGALTLRASVEQLGQEDDADSAASGGLSYSIGDVTAGVGVETQGDMQNIAAGVAAALGDASVKLVYGSFDDGEPGSDNVDAYSASASFVSGMATFTAFASSNSGNGDGDHFGIGASFDLGGGAAIKGGFVDGDSLTDGSFDLGITMSF